MTLEPLMLMIVLGVALSLMYYWLTRPDPQPTSLEEEITRRAIAKINWRKRPSLKTKSSLWNPGAPEQGMLVAIPFNANESVRLLFNEGRVNVFSTKHVNIPVELAAPDAINRLAVAIERAWTDQYK